MSFWRAIHKRLAVPWAWVLRIDVANGPIYVMGMLITKKSMMKKIMNRYKEATLVASFLFIEIEQPQ